MTELKKETKTQMVSVDARKMGQGLRMVFEGVTMIFDALGVETDFDCHSGFGGFGDQAEKVSTEEDAVIKDCEPAEMEPEKMKPEKQDAEESEQEESPEKRSTVTLDDVTKIIVQKIKKDRGNNEKIGQILKTYGVAKVGELPNMKYEAFLTDLSEL